jgi:Holliday junction resolvase
VGILRSLGMSVEITSAAHDGMTDLVVGYGGVTVLVEIKDGEKVPSKRQLTPAQVEFHERFKGAITIIENIDHAVKLAAEIRRVAAMVKPNWSMGAAGDISAGNIK